MNAFDLTACDREPIHVPGAIQPHGILLVVEAAAVVAGAGDVEGRLGVEGWLGRPLADIVGPDVAALACDVAPDHPGSVYLGVVAAPGGELLDASGHRSAGRLIVELEPGASAAPPAGVMLSELEAASALFERAPSVEALGRIAAAEFRRITGYDRVMIYRFLDDDSGAVIAEDLRDGMRSFLNHHFPATDIPRQARALYLRNLIRVIPDVDYDPAPVRQAEDADAPLDLSDAALRSVSPIHLQYLRNMGVRASASASIVKDGLLWGLVACHNETPRRIAFDVRAAARALAGALSRQIRVKDETDAFRERVRLRSFQDELVDLLSRDGSLDHALTNHSDEIRRALGGDGVAIIRGRDILRIGRCPPEADVRALAAWTIPRSAETVFSTDRLPHVAPEFAGLQQQASGVLAITLSVSEPWLVMWFRAEEVETVEWAGNPHKGVDAVSADILTPRTSFDAWSETVRARSRRWTAPEIEAAARLRSAVVEAWQTRRLRELNRRLVATIDEKDLLIKQKEFLIGEVNHRVQNSLQLVSSFLALQARSSGEPELVSALEEARRRLSAVALVHRRLYRADQVDTVDAARYLDELVSDIASSLGDDWARRLQVDVAPILLPTDRAISLGLILTELVINATKYAYGGAAGPLEISLVEHRTQFQLTVADHGVGKPASGRSGFGSRMIDALVRQLGGKLSYADNRPGLKVTLAADLARRADAVISAAG